MRRRRVAFLALLLVACGGGNQTAPSRPRSPSAERGGPRRLERLSRGSSWDEVIRYRRNAPRASLTVKNAWFKFPDGKKVTWIGVSVDGVGVGGCTRDEKLDPCIAALALEPGSHMVQIAASVTGFLHYDASHFFWATVVVGAREDVVLDVEQAYLTDDEKKYLARRKTGEPPEDACVAALEALGVAPSCTTSDVAAAEKLVASAQRACAGANRGDEVERAFRESLVADGAFNLFGTPMDRCYPSQQLRDKLPGLLHGDYDPDRTHFPPRTIRGGSWRWARDVLPDKLAEPGVAGMLRVLGASLPRLRERLEVVTAIAEAYLDKAKVPALLGEARGRPFTLDPTTPDGHRLFYILWDERWFYDEDFARWVTAGAAKDDSLDCGDRPSAVLVGYLLGGGERLTRDEWKTILAMMQRTPAEDGLGVCTNVVSKRVAGDVPAAERLYQMAVFDCSDKRDADIRGDAVAEFMHDHIDNADPAARERLKKDFAACVR